MLTVSKVTNASKSDSVVLKARTYSEVVHYLQGIPEYEYSEESLQRMKSLDNLFDNPSKKIEVITLSGTNGKSMAIHFAAKLLKEEDYRVGAAYSSHFLTFNERFQIDDQHITNKAFADVVSEVINVAEMNNIKATSFELLTMSALLYFKAEKVDVVLVEAGLGGRYDATALCTPIIAAVTRVTETDQQTIGKDLDQAAFHMMDVAKKGTWFISAEQSKLRLQKMKQWAEEQGFNWAMPIRKLAELPYIYQQLYGRVASLAERIARIYVEVYKGAFSPFLRENLLATQKGQRGRPTLEAKRKAELNPIKTLKTFWNEQFSLLRGRFELLEKEKPTLLLDNAQNADAFENLFLGIRLLHYQRPLKGLALIVSLKGNTDITEIVKSIRYLFKKVPGSVYFVTYPVEGVGHDVNQMAAVAKDMNIKTTVCATISQALDDARKNVDDRHGLICVTGSADVVREYWHQRGTKKLS